MAACSLFIPNTIAYITATTAPSVTNLTLNDGTKKTGVIFNAPVSETINALGIRLATKAGSAGGRTYTVEIQGVDGSGLPDGVVLSGSNATFDPWSWTDGTVNWVTISGAALTAGSNYAFVIRPTGSPDPDGSNNASFSQNETNTTPAFSRLPYVVEDTGSGWGKASNRNIPVWGFRTSSVTRGNPVAAWSTRAASSDGNRVTNKIVFNSSWGSTFKVGGLIVHRLALAAGGTWKGGIWNAAGTELASYQLDTDHTQSTAGGFIRGFFSGTLPTLSFGTTYYFGVERVSGATATANVIQFTNNRDLEAYPFGSAGVVSTWNGSAWTDVDTELLPITLAMNDWTVAAGGGINLAQGMTGGFHRS